MGNETAGNTGAPLETPLLRATRLFIYTTDAVKRLPSGKKVGNDRFKVEGFFDARSQEGRDFINAIIKFLMDTGMDKQASVNVVGMSMLTNGERPTPIGSIPDHWRRILANTKHGPVSSVKADGSVPKAHELFPGVYVRASVRPYVYYTPETQEPRVAFWLNSVFLERPGERLFGAQASTAFASRIHGGTSARAVLDDDVPF